MEKIIIDSPRLFIRSANSRLDIECLLKYRNDPDYMDLCTNKKKILSFNEFLEEYYNEFTKSRHLQTMIKTKKKSEVIGTMFSYGLNLYDGYVFITIFLEKQYREKGYAPEAIVSFMDFLFKKFSLYKIYMDVYEYNKLSLHTLIKRGAMIEGVFKGHRIYRDSRHDLYRFSVYQKDIQKIYQSVISICQKFAPQKNSALTNNPIN